MAFATMPDRALNLHWIVNFQAHDLGDDGNGKRRCKVPHQVYLAIEWHPVQQALCCFPHKRDESTDQFGQKKPLTIDLRSECSGGSLINSDISISCQNAALAGSTSQCVISL